MNFHGLLGRHLPHTWSPQLHQLIYDRIGYQGAYRPFEIEPDQLGEFFKAVDLLGVTGFNVTIPYKEAVIPYLDDLSEQAQTIGAVNTVCIKDGKFFGDNTDYAGIQALLKPFEPLQNKRIAVLGYGGASKGVIAYLQEQAVTDFVIVSRRQTEELHFDGRVISYEELPDYKGDILINTTPVGMAPDVGVSPISKEVFAGYEAAVDLIYNPSQTQFLKDAEAAGLVVQNGLLMLVVQAIRAVELWSGQGLSPEDQDWVMERMEDLVKQTLENRASDKANLNVTGPILLVGLPGSGKTTLGQALADYLGVPFFDSDLYIEETTGKSVKTLFEEGESVFREEERKALDNLVQQGAAIISTGGGIVLNAENRNLLKQQQVIYLERPISQILVNLDADSRPLLRDNPNKIYELHLERETYYKEVASLRYQNKGTIEEDMLELVELIMSL
ncbi:shikimate kinase [Granulicatella seriolae]|uniref:Multifunctional fusion protein n=1 Tax=Granulicatella seriolae TaxID=2967226 RepID=A0ABT1WNP7_9LACT|nr:shikimate kinase [Granulicatella seriolae]